MCETVNRMISSGTLSAVLAVVSILVFTIPSFIRFCGKSIGNYVRGRSQERRKSLLAKAASEKKQPLELHTALTATTSVDDEWEKIDKNQSQSASDLSATQVEKHSSGDWNGIIGFFHPFCDAGGGGERVLWAAIRATQQNWPNALCVVYTGDHNVSKEQILSRVKERFNIELFAPTVTFLYLSTRNLVLSSTWPHFTLLGQSLGSLILGCDAFNLMTPDVFIDTMGYAFTHALSKFLFPDVPVGAYVHYPTISTDMLGSLNAESDSGQGVNAGTGVGWKGFAKRQYWELFAKLYGWVGGSADVVMANSSWTGSHIRSLWGPTRSKRKQKYPIEVVFPPVAVSELERTITVSSESEMKRQSTLLYIAQFRPEKNHQLILRSFAKLLQAEKYSNETESKDRIPRLLLIGSVRNDTDETYIYGLRLLAHELHITEFVTFLLNVSWANILSHLQTASVGVNGMWNEHFGIGVVEYQAAGLISVVHNSGGPKLDIVVDEGDGPTGYHASTEEEFTEAFEKALSLPREEAFAMRQRARKNAIRFGEETFDEQWKKQMERLVGLRMKK